MKEFKKYRLPFWIGLILVVASSYFSGRHALFEVVPNLDKIFHMAGGMIAAWMALIYFRPDLGKLTEVKQFMVIVGVAALIGVLWEIAEYAVGVLTIERWPLVYQYFHGGNIADTIHDLVADTIGAVIVALWRRPQ